MSKAFDVINWFIINENCSVFVFIDISQSQHQFKPTAMFKIKEKNLMYQSTVNIFEGEN